MAAIVQDPNYELDITTRFLRDRNLDLSKKSENDISQLAVNILQIFGAKYASASINGLDNRITEKVRCLYYVFKEILEGRDKPFSRDNYPHTTQLIDSLPGHGQADKRVFLQLQEEALFFSPFPHRDEDKRDAALAFKLLINPPEMISIEDGVMLSTLYFNRVAFIYDDQPVMYSELLESWGASSAKNCDACKALYEKIPGRSAAVEDVIKPIDELVIEGYEHSFKEYLAEVTCRFLEKKLEVEFTKELKALLARVFRSEAIRIDVILKFGNWDRLGDVGQASRKFLTALKMFQSIYEKTKIHPRSPELLEMLWQAGSSMPLHNLQECEDIWQALVDKRSNEFSIVLGHYLCLVEQIQPRDISYEHCHALKLFIFFWESLSPEEHQARVKARQQDFLDWKYQALEDHVDAFVALNKTGFFSLTLKCIYKFCMTNKPKIEREVLAAFVDAYVDVLEEMNKREIVEHAEFLFLDPPIDVRCVKWDDPSIFVDHYVRCNTHLPGLSFAGLRDFILFPQAHVFQVVEDVKELGIQKITSEMAEIAHRSLAKIHAIKKEALSIAKQLQENYHFSKVQLFELYVPLLCREIKTFRASLKVTKFLQSFCPSINKEILHFLLCSEVTYPKKEIKSLVRRRREFATSEYSKNNHTLHPKEISANNFEINAFINQLLSKRGEELRYPLFQALHAAFLPPIQFLTTFFRIEGLDPARGIEWQSPDLANHIGQFQPIFLNSSLKVYLNWSVQKGFPSLSITFYDEEKRFGRSGAIRLPITIDTIHEKIPRAFSMLFELSQMIFMEKVERDGFSRRGSLDHFPGARETLEFWRVENPRQIEKDQQVFLEFLKKVKKEYRRLFLDCIMKEKGKEMPSEDSILIASRGNIFCKDGKNLVLFPSDDLRSFLKCYQAESIRCFNRFRENTDRFKNLGAELNMTDNSGEKTLPLEYHVITSTELVLVDEDDCKRPEEEELVMSTVTLRIKDSSIFIPLQYPRKVLDSSVLSMDRFKFHTLLLKAQYYQNLVLSE